MENGGFPEPVWNFQPNQVVLKAKDMTIRAALETLMSNLNSEDSRPVIPLVFGDPSVFPCFRTTSLAEEALVSSIASASFNGHAPKVGLLSARRAASEYLSRDLPYKLSPNDVYLTNGCAQAMDLAISVLSHPGSNILLPRPQYPSYKALAACKGVEVRYFDLLPERNWEIDLDAVEALADANTVAMIIINPVNPCGNVFSYQHLAKVAETARKLGVLVLADEVYAHLTFGSHPFVPMGVFGSIVPVITLGSISKRWVVPGWRLGWLVTCDPTRILQKNKITECIKSFLDLSSSPATFIQAAIPEILENTSKDFFDKIINLLRQTSDICYNGLTEISCINCPHKPEGSMAAMVKLDFSHLEDIHDDMDFCAKLAREESVLVLPGSELGANGWLRVAFAVEPSLLEAGLERMKTFCRRHAKRE